MQHTGAGGRTRSGSMVGVSGADELFPDWQQSTPKSGSAISSPNAGGRNEASRAETFAASEDFDREIGLGVNEPRPVSLSRLVVELKRKFNEVGLIAVEGEVSNPKTYRTMVYFVLRDRNTQISVRVKLGLAKQRLIVEGERIQVTGRLDVNGERGSFQLDALDIQPVGEGAIAAAIAEARERLRADGILERPRRSLPLLPRGIAVVCGTEAAVRHDIQSVVADRFPGYPIVWFETVLQGPSAVGGICAALDRVANDARVDVVILARGGGDATALLPFSDERVCRRAAEMSIAVVSAIGHDADRPLLDEVADIRCGTPSIAAARVVPARTDLELLATQRLQSIERVLFDRLDAAEVVLRERQPSTAVLGVLAQARSRLARAQANRRSRHPRIESERARSRLQQVPWRTHPPQRLSAANNRLSLVEASLDALDPMRTLQRGYALVRTSERRLVTNIAGADIDQSLIIQVADGSFGAVVTSIEKDSK